MIAHIYKYIDETMIHCYNIDGHYNKDILFSLLDITQSYQNFDYNDYVEYGPYITMMTPWCSNALSILKNIKRIELSYLIKREYFNESMIDKMTQTIYDQPLQQFISTIDYQIEQPYEVHNIELENRTKKLGFDKDDIQFYKNIFKNRNPTNIELYDLAQSNSEHSRHWFFNAKLTQGQTVLTHSLMKMIKETLANAEINNKKSVVAFCDNSSAIDGYYVQSFYPKSFSNQYILTTNKYNPVFTAETHNFPTSIAPFQGATTGVGGRIRDNQSIGRGGLCIAGTAGYSVGNILNNRSITILIEASNGASDYGNKFGEPIIQGFCRSFGMTMDDNERIEYVKPIMFSGGIGQMDERHTHKEKELDENVMVVRLGGPAYKIGIGGGSSSSRDQNTKNIHQDLSAVQRGDPEMENRLNRVIRTCIEMGENNPILSIHDQGAGGMANVTKEIVYPNGAKINLNNVNVGDNTMSILEIWVSEHQEQNTVLVKDLPLLETVCRRENLPMSVIGNIDNSGKLTVIYDNQKVVEFELEEIIGKNILKKTYELYRKHPYVSKLYKPHKLNLNLNDALDRVLKSLSVCSKGFLVNKVDRSVSGLIAQQQCCGPLHLPVSDFSVVAQSYFNLTGIVSSIGERPIIGLIDPIDMARMSIGEMLTNMIFCKIDKMEYIRCSGNWMWPANCDGEKHRLYYAVKAMCECMNELGIALDGGKDSLSMTYRHQDEVIKSVGTLVVSGYTTTNDIRKKATPDFKTMLNYVYYLNLSDNKFRLGGSTLYQEYDQIGIECPNFENIPRFRYVFQQIQDLVDKGIILAGHDVSDGGIITTLLEMCFSGNKGFIGNISTDVNIYEFLFAEELGIVFEINPKDCKLIESLFDKSYCQNIGTIIDKDFRFRINNDLIYDSIDNLRQKWEETSYRMEKLQSKIVNSNVYPQYELPHFTLIDQSIPTIPTIHDIKIAIIREEGSNGDREMAAAFYSAGFDVYDINMYDLINYDYSLDQFQGIAFVGGFSYSDVFGAGKGWYQVIKSNPRISKEFDRFYQRNDTFSLGVCNGCQLMSLLGWVPKCRLESNDSGKFESRFSYVKINKNRSIMLDNMEESILGIWVAHGEGKMTLLEEVHPDMVPLQYVDHEQHITDEYPYNPNGSDLGITALCSIDGRHLAMMPHPERTFLDWQKPINNQKDHIYSHWFQMFVNAYQWSKKTDE